METLVVTKSESCSKSIFLTEHQTTSQTPTIRNIFLPFLLQTVDSRRSCWIMEYSTAQPPSDSSILRSITFKIVQPGMYPSEGRHTFFSFTFTVALLRSGVPGQSQR